MTLIFVVIYQLQFVDQRGEKVNTKQILAKLKNLSIIRYSADMEIIPYGSLNTAQNNCVEYLIIEMYPLFDVRWCAWYFSIMEWKSWITLSNLLLVCELNISAQIYINGSKFIWKWLGNYINYTNHGFHIIFTAFGCP